MSEKEFSGLGCPHRKLWLFCPLPVPGVRVLLLLLCLGTGAVATAPAYAEEELADEIAAPVEAEAAEDFFEAADTDTDADPTGQDIETGASADEGAADDQAGSEDADYPPGTAEQSADENLEYGDTEEALEYGDTEEALEYGDTEEALEYGDTEGDLEYGDIEEESFDPVEEAVEELAVEELAVDETGPEAGESVARASPERVVEEVIVQAERRDASLQSTAVAVSAFTQKSLTDSDLTDVTDLTGRVPGLVVTGQEDQSDIKIFIRGVGTNNPTETGDQGVGVYVDGIFAARAQGALALFYDLESVQVLRGPQGTLFGRNNTGGALLLRTRRPGDDLAGDLQLTYGSFNRQQASGGISLPFTDNWSIRVAAYLDRDDGWVDAIGTDPRGSNHNFSGLVTGRVAGVDTKLNNTDVRSARLTSLWNLTDRVYWFLSFETFSDQGIHGIVLTPDKVNRGIYESFIDSPVSLDLISNVWRSIMSFDLSDSTNLEYLFGYAKLDRSQVVDQDFGLFQEFREARTEYQDTASLSHELKFAGSVADGVLDWTTGLYFFTEETGIRFDFDANGGDLQGGATFIQPARGAVSWAAYAQATYRPVEALGLTLGLRYTNDLKYDRGGHNYGDCEMLYIRPSLGGDGLQVFSDFVNNVTGAEEPDGLDDDTGLERVRGRQCAANTRNDLEKRDDEVTWLARISYNIVAEHEHLLYLSVGTGYRASVIQDAGNSTEPETSTSYEFGTKSEFDVLRLNTTAFFIDYEDLIRSGFDEDLQRIVVSNVSAAEIFGAEIELTWLVGKGGQIDFSGSFLRALYADYLIDDVGVSTNNPEVINAAGERTGLYDLKGNTMPNSPMFQFTLGFSWDISVGSAGSLVPRMTVLFSDDIYFSDGNDNRVAIESFVNDTLIEGFIDGTPITQKANFKIDLGLNYANESGWGLDLFVNNLLNEMTLSSPAGAATPDGIPGRWHRPRTWGLRFQMFFE